MLEFLFKSDFIFTTRGSLGARVQEVHAHQTWQFTSNMLEFLFKSDLILTTTGSSGTQLREVQVQFMHMHIQGRIPRKFGFISQGSSTAHKKIVQVR
jgi:hypothetical protein